VASAWEEVVGVGAEVAGAGAGAEVAGAEMDKCNCSTTEPLQT